MNRKYVIITVVVLVATAGFLRFTPPGQQLLKSFGYATAGAAA